jgi:mannose-1-phosphate guanylyltransferase
MFFWQTSTVLGLMKEHQPKTAELLANLPAFGSKQFNSKLAETYPLCENISVDYAIIEKAKTVSGIALDDIGWNDVGSWDAVFELARKDASKNASRGDLIAVGSTGNYVDSAKTVALVGVNDLVIVDTPDALLVANRHKAQNVSKVVKMLDEAKREELL